MKPVIIIAIAFVFLIPLLISPSFAESDCIRLDGKVVTMLLENDVDDYLLIKDNLIVATGKINQEYPDNVNCNNIKEIQTNGIIFPGLINIHNHLDWNVFPLWSVPDKYETRYEWQNVSEYDRDLSEPHRVLKQNFKIEMMKFAEVKALVGGTTTLQGASYPWENAFTKILVRNVEHDSDVKVKIQSRIGEITLNNTYYEKVLKNIQEDKTQVFIQHLAEGTNGTAKDEFTTLKKLDLLREQVVIIHGTALESQEFGEMSASNTKLAWSPLSNLLLYGDTTNVADAWNSGVLVSLTSDWSPSGSKNVLWELKAADWWNKKSFDKLFSDYDLVKMVTVNPAISINWDDSVGMIAPNYLADLVVINDYNSDNPYRALIDASDSDVLLVIINGDAIYGTKDLMQNLGKNEFDEVGCTGWTRALDTTNPLIDKGDQTWNDIIDTLEQEMNSDKFKNLLSIESPYYSQTLPTPLFSSCDDDFIKTLEQSHNENFSELLDNYNPKVPEWIQSNAKWWSEGTIDDDDFIGGIQYLMQEKIINIPNLTEQSLDSSKEKIPDWVKNTAGWWADGLIGEEDFLNGIKYLVEKDIIKI